VKFQPKKNTDYSILTKVDEWLVFILCMPENSIFLELMIEFNNHWKCIKNCKY
jgi:hypothetical protein